MLNNYTFKYGKKKVSADLQGFKIIGEVTSKNVPQLADIEKSLAEALENPINSLPFSEIFKAEDHVLIVISDITRAWINYPAFLPLIIERLHFLGIKDTQITLLTATGTHREQSEEEKKALIGEDLYNRFRIIDHDSLKQEMISLGMTSSGNEVFVNALVRGRKVILTGGITPHLMAGFGGGRKSAVPGISSYETIQRNHLLALDPEAPHSSPLIGLGSVDRNPLHLDMKEACALLDPDFLVNVTINDEGKLAGIFAGNWNDAWLKGTEWIRSNYFIPVPGKADLVIASSGGYPKDINLYQATKTLFNAVNGIRDGGSLIFLAECAEGAGADSFFNWSIPLRENRLDQALRKDFTIPGYIFYAAIEAARKVDVYLVSEMDPEDIEMMGFIPCKDLDEAIRKVRGKHPEEAETLLLPFGGSTVPVAL